MIHRDGAFDGLADRTAWNQGRMPSRHKAAQGIGIGVVTNLSQERSCRVGEAEPHQREAAIIRPGTAVTDDVVDLRTGRTSLLPGTDNGQHSRHIGPRFLRTLSTGLPE